MPPHIIDVLHAHVLQQILPFLATGVGGELRTADGLSYRGAWRSGRPHGKGVMEWPWGDSYTGEFRDGKREGRGVMVFANGDSFRGEFVADEPEGDGVYEFAAEDDDAGGEDLVARFEGGFRSTWRKGTFTRGDVAFKATWNDGEGAYVAPFAEGLFKSGGVQRHEVWIDGNVDSVEELNAPDSGPQSSSNSIARSASGGLAMQTSASGTLKKLPNVVGDGFGMTRSSSLAVSSSGFSSADFVSGPHTPAFSGSDNDSAGSPRRQFDKRNLDNVGRRDSADSRKDASRRQQGVYKRDGSLGAQQAHAHLRGESGGAAALEAVAGLGKPKQSSGAAAIASEAARNLATNGNSDRAAVRAEDELAILRARMAEFSRTIQGGGMFLKYSRRGKAKMRQVWVTEDGQRVCWAEPSPDGPPQAGEKFSSIPLADVKEVMRECPKEEVRKKLGKAAKPDMVFGFVTPTRTLYLQADSVSYREFWSERFAIMAILARDSPEDPFAVRELPVVAGTESQRRRSSGDLKGDSKKRKKKKKKKEKK